MALNPEGGRRLHVLSLLERGRITTAQAAEALGITPRQVRRLGRRLQQHGPEGLACSPRDSGSPRILSSIARRPGGVVPEH
jgi:predicted ArsR family transcriptional regulator